MKYLIGIDNGGTFVKAGVVSGDGRLLAVAREPVDNLTPQPGFTERDMDGLLRKNETVIKRAVEQSGIDPAGVAGISFSGHGKGLYTVGKDGKPAYNGILSTDNRAWEYAENWKRSGTAEQVRAITYQDILACQPVSLLAWMRDHEPEAFGRIRYVFSVNDYIRYCLTGTANGEYTCSSGSNLVDMNSAAYSRSLLGLFGLDPVYDMLPPLKASTEICGYVTETAAARTGLRAGTPVTAGMFDVDACAVASGVCNEELICMIAGTWSINEYVAKAPVTNGTVSLNSMFCIPGYFLIEESSPTSAGNMQWFIDELLPELKEKAEKEGTDIYGIVNEWAGSVEPQDCTVLFLPFLNGSNEDPLARGCFIGLTDFHDRRHMLRAVYEGIVFSHMTHVKRLLKNRRKPEKIRLAGGAANSDVWVRIFADALQIPIEVVDCKEQGIVGAAMAAGIGAGMFKSYEEAAASMVRVSKTVFPRPEYGPVYEKKYEAYRAAAKALDPVWRQIRGSGEAAEPGA